MKIVRRGLAVLLWALLLLPFFFAAQGAHPATDDFTFATYTHATWLATGSVPHVIKDALSYTLRTWRDWQGTMTGVLVMALNPAVFSLEYYWVHAVILLALCLAAWFVFLRHVMKTRMGMDNDAFIPAYLAATAATLAYLPDMVEGIYWFNGAWFYMGAQAAALITLTLCDRFSATQAQGAKRIAFAALCCVLLLALGMNNYITAMMTASALAMMALIRLWAARQEPLQAVTGVLMDDGWQEHLHGGKDAAQEEKTAAKRTALLLIPIVAGLLISVFAPGNAVRMAADGAHESGAAYLFGSIVRTLEASAGYFVRFALKTPLPLVLWAITPAVCRGLKRIPVRRDYRTPPMTLTLLGMYLILCAMIIPHMYASGNAGSGRVVNMYHCYVMLAVPVAWMMLLLRMKPETRAWLCSLTPRAVTGAACAMLLVLCALGGQHGNYVKLVSDLRDGTQDAYIAQFENEYALCEAAGEEDDVYLPAWTVQTMTGKPTAYEDPAVWTNEAMADYFGVRSVRVGEKPAESAQEAPEEAAAAEPAAQDDAGGQN